MKKGAVQQVFIYLMVIIVVGTLMIIGYKAIGALINKMCDVNLATFKSNLKTSLQRNSNYGSSEIKSFTAPCSYDKICFLNITGVNQNLLSEYPSIKSEYGARTGQQMFFIQGKKVIGVNLVVRGLEVKDGFFCINSTGGKFTVKMEGISRGKVLVSDPLA